MEYYATDWVKPSEEQWVADRLVEESGSSPISKQHVNTIQHRIITISCAGFSDIVLIIRTLQDDDEWCVNVENNMSPVQDGLNLWKGTISAQRYLRLGTRDDGYYRTGVTSF